MSIPKRSVSVLLPADLHAQLQMLAQDSCRSLSAYIRQVLKQHIRTVKSQDS